MVEELSVYSTLSAKDIRTLAGRCPNYDLF
jgi:hypothetical protein